MKAQEEQAHGTKKDGTGKDRNRTEKNKNRRRKEAQEDPQGTCTLCGQLYHNFAFKGGYICEDCLNSIKLPDEQNQKPERKSAETQQSC